MAGNGLTEWSDRILGSARLQGEIQPHLNVFVTALVDLGKSESPEINLEQVIDFLTTTFCSSTANSQDGHHVLLCGMLRKTKLSSGDADIFQTMSADIMDSGFLTQEAVQAAANSQPTSGPQGQATTAVARFAAHAIDDTDLQRRIQPLLNDLITSITEIGKQHGFPAAVGDTGDFIANAIFGQRTQRATAWRSLLAKLLQKVKSSQADASIFKTMAFGEMRVEDKAELELALQAALARSGENDAIPAASPAAPQAESHGAADLDDEAPVAPKPAGGFGGWLRGLFSSRR